jgi:hypothetical protein
MWCRRSCLAAGCLGKRSFSHETTELGATAGAAAFKVSLAPETHAVLCLVSGG